MSDQWDEVEFSEERGGKIYTSRRPRRFRQESVWPVLALLDVPDPAAVFDQVIFIARLRLERAWR